MKCEIEFLAVGDAAKAGDAIVVRYGEPDAFGLMLVDGGHAATGDRIVRHLRRNFTSRVFLEHVVLTHSDGDHASGLRTVLREVPVRNLWLHVPWLLAEQSRHLFLDKRFSEEGLRKKLLAEYDIVAEILDLAAEAGCKLHFPFAGERIGPFTVLSPSLEAYRYLLPQFDRTPAADQVAIEQAGMWIGKRTALDRVLEAARAKVHSWTTERWDAERLRNGGLTSASNESSVVLYGSFEKGPVLLTGDAGINGLTWAADAADALGLPLRRFRFVQIPHHGSRRNVGPDILDRLLGPKLAEGSAPRFSAYVSAPAEDADHPRRIVLNAFKRRGGKIIATQGKDKCHNAGFPGRAGYGPSEEMPFFTRVEEYT
ncbi:ComEC/Rec2 family competence protein [Methylobacterium brachiatum]|uniref:ComEC/Rec2 family competence protein n=1 Tax=Methylobacterium brachiatum TaxID=269660 RepID=UPI0008EC9996|nr:MBL fold metallo-hydrolase [Methylobacterium brachiatum]SFI50798.1 Metallo-beta-lactamase superfamily protein [Methylobacterium brachiatum]